MCRLYFKYEHNQLFMFGRIIYLCLYLSTFWLSDKADMVLCTVYAYHLRNYEIYHGKMDVAVYRRIAARLYSTKQNILSM